jgi:hypothetical protein
MAKQTSRARYFRMATSYIQLRACEFWEVQYSKCAGIFPRSKGLDTSDSGWLLKESHVSILAKNLKLRLEEGLSS